MTRPTPAQLETVLAILINARDAALIDKLAIELGLDPERDGLSFLRHLDMAARAVGADLLPVRMSASADVVPFPKNTGAPS